MLLKNQLVKEKWLLERHIKKENHFKGKKEYHDTGKDYKTKNLQQFIIQNDNIELQNRKKFFKVKLP